MQVCGVPNGALFIMTRASAQEVWLPVRTLQEIKQLSRKRPKESSQRHRFKAGTINRKAAMGFLYWLGAAVGPRGWPRWRAGGARQGSFLGRGAGGLTACWFTRTLRSMSHLWSVSPSLMLLAFSAPSTSFMRLANLLPELGVARSRLQKYLTRPLNNVIFAPL